MGTNTEIETNTNVIRTREFGKQAFHLTCTLDNN